MFTTPLITVAIATCNRADILKRSLTCLIDQNFEQAGGYEVLTIDNGSTDRTEEIVRTFEQANGKAVQVRYVREEQKGLPFVRNMAVRESRGEWLAFFDDDQLTDPNWLETLYQTAISQDARFVGGARDLQIEVKDPLPLAKESRKLLGETSHQEAQPYHAKFLPSTGNVLIHKSIFDEVGMFDSDVLDGGEDSDFFSRVVSKGIKGVYNPKALVHHLITANRLEADYMKWIAYRHGIHVARRDVQTRGTFLSVCLACVRWGRMSFVYAPNRILAASRGQGEEVTGIDCKIEKSRGYFGYLWCQLFPTEFNRQRLAQRSMHRGQR